jgi:predicted amidohydrolase
MPQAPESRYFPQRTQRTQSKATQRCELAMSPEFALSRPTFEIFASFASFADKKLDPEIDYGLVRE